MAVAPGAGEDLGHQGASRSGRHSGGRAAECCRPRGTCMRFKKLSSPGRVLVAVLALLTPVVIGASAGSAHAIPAPVDWTVLVGNQAGGMAIQGQKFLPGDITIDAGDSVT